MGITTGIVVGQSIEENRGGDTVRLLQVELLGESPETVEWFDVTGEDTAPVEGDKVIIKDLGGGYKIAAATKDFVTAAVSAGERKFYSRDSAGTVKAFIHLKDDGSINVDVPGGLNINGNTVMTGTLTVSGIIKSFVDIIADYATTAITMLTHYHFGNLGRNTSVGAVTGGTALPGNPPTMDNDGDVITGTDTTSLDDHTHPYSWTDPGGSGNTGAPN